jgi:hypothetical protein
MKTQITNFLLVILLGSSSVLEKRVKEPNPVLSNAWDDNKFFWQKKDLDINRLSFIITSHVLCKSVLQNVIFLLIFKTLHVIKFLIRRL